MFQKARKTQSKLRLAIDGPSGAGKTYTALIAASAMANGGKIAVIDTERNSASLYADKFNFDVACLDNFNPNNYINAIHEAEQAGYAVIVIDSLSHAWEGEGGVLDMHDDATKRSRSENGWAAWRDVTPVHRDLVDAILQSPVHIISTMRSKMDYVQTTENGSTKIKKVGMAPIQRAGMEYEFTIVGDMDVDHNFIVTKSRCDFIADAVVKKPDAVFFKKILDWLNSGDAQPVTSREAEQRSPSNNGHKEPAPEEKKLERPYSPEMLAKTISVKAKKLGNFTASDKQIGLLASMLDKCFAGEENSADLRHAVQQYLTGYKSSKDMPGAYVKVLLDWLDAKQDDGGDYTPSAMAIKEAQAIRRQSLIDAGQMDLLATAQELGGLPA